MLNDSATPATDASLGAPGARSTAQAKSFARGGTVAYARAAGSLERGLGELTGHLIGDGCLTDIQTVWVYGGDDVDDGTLDSARRRTLLRAVRRRVAPGHGQRDGAAARRQRGGARAVARPRRHVSARAHDKRVPASIFTAPTEVAGGVPARPVRRRRLRVARRDGGKANRYVGLGSRSDALLQGRAAAAQRVRHPRPIYRVTRSRRADVLATRATTAPRSSTTPRAGFDLRITGSRPRALRGDDRLLDAAGRTTRCERCSDATTALRARSGTRRRSRARPTARRRSSTSPSRSTTRTSSTASSSRTAASTCTSTTRRATSRRST